MLKSVLLLEVADGDRGDVRFDSSEHVSSEREYVNHGSDLTLLRITIPAICLGHKVKSVYGTCSPSPSDSALFAGALTPC